MTLTKTTTASDQLIEKVAFLIKEVDSTHRYSMSRIYGLYNEVFTTAEVPQSCASCLIRKVNQLKTWLADQPNKEDIKPVEMIKTTSKKGKKVNKSDQ